MRDVAGWIQSSGSDMPMPGLVGKRPVRLNGALILIYLIALADTFGGLLQGIVPATLLLRTAMLGFLLIFLLGTPSIRPEIRVISLILFGYLLTRALLNYFFLHDARVLSTELGSSSRLLYFPLLYIFLSYQLKRKRITHDDLRRLLVFYGWLILASLFLGYATGLGGVVGGRGAEIEGGKGFMIGANEVGLMLLLTAPFIGADLIRRTHSMIVGAGVQVAMYLLAGIHVFTKASLVAALISAFSAYHAFVKRGGSAKWLARIALFVIFIYLAKLVFRNLELIEALASETFFAALLNDGVMSFLFRGRQYYISAIYPQLIGHDLNWLFLLFGAGEYLVREASVAPLGLLAGEGTTFEMDFFDLLASYGVVGFTLFTVLVVAILREGGPYRIPIDIKVVVFSVMAHSFLAGHVLFSPQVTTLLALTLLRYRALRISVHSLHIQDKSS